MTAAKTQTLTAAEGVPFDVQMGLPVRTTRLLLYYVPGHGSALNLPTGAEGVTAEPPQKDGTCRVFANSPQGGVYVKGGLEAFVLIPPARYFWVRGGQISVQFSGGLLKVFPLDVFARLYPDFYDDHIKPVVESRP